MGEGIDNDDGGMMVELGFENSIPSDSVCDCTDSDTQDASATPIFREALPVVPFSFPGAVVANSLRGVRMSLPFSTRGVLARVSARPRSEATERAISRSPSFTSLSAYSFFSRRTALWTSFSETSQIISLRLSFGSIRRRC